MSCVAPLIAWSWLLSCQESVLNETLFWAASAECAASFTPLHVEWQQLVDGESSVFRALSSRTRLESRVRGCLWVFYTVGVDLSSMTISVGFSSLITEPLSGQGAFYFGAHHMRNSCGDKPFYLSVL